MVESLAVPLDPHPSHQSLNHTPTSLIFASFSSRKLQRVRNNLHEIWQQMLIAVREIAALTGLMICGECSEAQTVKGNEMSDGSASVRIIILLPTLSLSPTRRFASSAHTGTRAG